MYRKYDNKVPKYLHNRPTSVVQHIMKRASPMYPSNFVKKCTQQLFMVESETSNTKYQVWLGSDTQLPSCQCMDFKINKLPCKHICAVVSQPEVGWNSLGKSFHNHPLFTLDSTLVEKATDFFEKELENPKVSERSDESNPTTFVADRDCLAASVQTEPSAPQNRSDTGIKYKELKKRKQPSESNCRAKCIKKLIALNDELYVVKDNIVLTKIESLINDALIYARENQPAEYNLPLKDKTLSPKRKKKKVEVKKFRGTKRSLTLHLKRKQKKRYGVGAESLKKATNLTISANGSLKNKNSEKKQRIDLTSLQNEKETTSHWLNIEGITLTKSVQEILNSPAGWLGDDHVDAAQRLLKSMVNSAEIGGLNDIVAMTHFEKTKVNEATKDYPAIQCHNIGCHWVVSTSMQGKITVYESLTTGLNDTLLQQLVRLYSAYCDNDHLTVTVFMEQLQKGSSDCGLFCIANATALAFGIDPVSVSWEQSKMRAHLAQCFEKKKMLMFPHTASNEHKQFKIYEL